MADTTSSMSPHGPMATLYTSFWTAMQAAVHAGHDALLSRTPLPSAVLDAEAAVQWPGDVQREDAEPSLDLARAPGYKSLPEAVHNLLGALQDSNTILLKQEEAVHSVLSEAFQGAAATVSATALASLHHVEDTLAACRGDMHELVEQMGTYVDIDREHGTDAKLAQLGATMRAAADAVAATTEGRRTDDMDAVRLALLYEAAGIKAAATSLQPSDLPRAHTSPTLTQGLQHCLAAAKLLRAPLPPVAPTSARATAELQTRQAAASFHTRLQAHDVARKRLTLIAQRRELLQERYDAAAAVAPDADALGRLTLALQSLQEDADAVHGQRAELSHAVLEQVVAAASASQQHSAALAGGSTGAATATANEVQVNARARLEDAIEAIRQAQHEGRVLDGCKLTLQVTADAEVRSALRAATTACLRRFDDCVQERRDHLDALQKQQLRLYAEALALHTLNESVISREMNSVVAAHSANSAAVAANVRHLQASVRAIRQQRDLVALDQHAAVLHRHMEAVVGEIKRAWATVNA